MAPKVGTCAQKQPEEQICYQLEGRMPGDEAANTDGPWGAACASGEGGTDTRHPRALWTPLEEPRRE